MTKKDITFKPNEEVCSSWIKIQIEENEPEKENNKVSRIIFLGGCPGNSLALTKILEGKTVKEIIEGIRGVRCGAKSTSCPDQLATALQEYLDKEIKIKKGIKRDVC